MKHSLWLSALALGTLMACQGPAEETATAEETTEAVTEKGYQLYTVREALTGPEAIASTLKETKSLGYDKLESFGYMKGSFLGMTVTDFMTTLSDAQLSSPSGHYMPVQLEGSEVGPIDTATISQFIEAAATLNQHWIIIPWMSEAWRNPKGYAHLVEYLKLLGAEAAKHGKVAAWHNHDFEFLPLDPTNPESQSAYQYLLESLEGHNVVFEMDVHWVAYAGENPVTWMENYPGRFPLWHVKDFATDTTTQVPVGQGVVPWEEIFAMAETAGLQHYFIEQDVCSADHALTCLQESIEWANEQSFMNK